MAKDKSEKKKAEVEDVEMADAQVRPSRPMPQASILNEHLRCLIFPEPNKIFQEGQRKGEGRDCDQRRGPLANSAPTSAEKASQEAAQNDQERYVPLFFVLGMSNQWFCSIKSASGKARRKGGGEGDS